MALKTKNELSNSAIFTLLIVGFIVTLFFKEFRLLKPLSFYVTSVHEVCHGLAAILTNGKVHEINLHGNGGTAHTSGGVYPIISMAGYVGTAFIGAILLFFSQKEKWIDRFLIVFSITMLVINSIYINSYLNLYYISSVVLSLLILFSVRFSFTRHIGVFLSALFIFDSFTDAKIYLFYRFIGTSKVAQEIIYKTDAGILARYFGNEKLTVFIGIGFFLINIVIYSFTFYLIFKRKRV
ncbi:MAG: M50 family metallopeptidase [Flavobacteriaceae bacterium]